jgi:hypothetical protein
VQLRQHYDGRSGSPTAGARGSVALEAAAMFAGDEGGESAGRLSECN